MKRTILAIALAAALPAKAGERPSKADMFNGLLVVGVYSKLCPTPLSKYAETQAQNLRKLLGDADASLLEYSIMAYRDGLRSQNMEQWCRETAKVLSDPG